MSDGVININIEDISQMNIKYKPLTFLYFYSVNAMDRNTYTCCFDGCCIYHVRYQFGHIAFFGYPPMVKWRYILIQIWQNVHITMHF